MPVVGASIQAAAGIAQTVSGIVNSAKTKKIAKELEKTRPKYAISQLAKDDLSLSESEASIGGLSSRAETAYNNLNNQQFSSSLGAILRGGGSVNNVADVYGNAQEGRTRLALLNDQMRLQKINNLMKTRDMYREQQDKTFQINEYAPWKDKQMANAEARQQAQNQLWGGISQIGAAGGTLAAGQNPFAEKKTAQPTATTGATGFQRVPWERGQYTATDYRAGQQGGIFGDPDPYLSQFRTD